MSLTSPPANGTTLEVNPARCPLTRCQGILKRTRQGAELFSAYQSYLGHALPREFEERYFASMIAEYECDESGLRWYVPSHLGDGAFYAALARIYPWYYVTDTWDKAELLKHVRDARPACVVEIGCGDGTLLERVAALGVKCLGIDLNSTAVARARTRGLRAFTPDEEHPVPTSVDLLYMLQTIEHVSDPLAFLREYVTEFQPKEIVLSAPSFEGLLGYTSDPLVWPPHHATCWSERAFATLADLLGYKLVAVKRTPLNYRTFRATVALEPSPESCGLPILRRGLAGRLAFAWLRVLKRPYAQYGHSILVRLERSK